jgi:hypothetical protein
MKRATITLSSLFRIEERKHSDKMLLEKMIQCKPIEVGRQWATTKLGTQPADWVNSKWARVVLWFLRKKYLKRLIPYPIECLVHAQYVVNEPHAITLKEELLDSIYQQLGLIIYNGMEPEAIYVGRITRSEIHKVLDFNLFFPIREEKNHRIAEVQGLPVYVHPLLKESEILVTWKS